MRNGLPEVLEQLEHACGGLTDGKLLDRFVATRDEASFAALVRRHGPMVLGVCRRVLRDVHDAEDAFQATFLVLARKAAGVVKRDSVGSYLYAIAYHTALEAAHAKSRRRARERQMTDMPQPHQAAPAETLDWRPLLDQELNRLSEWHRSAVVLCDLEGRPRREAAQLLGVAEGTLSSRLNRARKLLAQRLTGRGVLLSPGALAAAMARDVALGHMPAALVGSTVRAATLVAAGRLTAASLPAVSIMKGVMKAMLMRKLKVGLGAVMVAAAISAVGFTCLSGEAVWAQPSGPSGGDGGGGGRPGGGPAAAGRQSELENLRKENERLKKNNDVLLDRLIAMEAEIKNLRGQRGFPGGGGRGMSGGFGNAGGMGSGFGPFGGTGGGTGAGPGPGAGGPPGGEGGQPDGTGAGGPGAPPSSGGFGPPGAGGRAGGRRGGGAGDPGNTPRPGPGGGAGGGPGFPGRPGGASGFPGGPGSFPGGGFPGGGGGFPNGPAGFPGGGFGGAAGTGAPAGPDEGGAKGAGLKDANVPTELTREWEAALKQLQDAQDTQQEKEAWQALEDVVKKVQDRIKKERIAGGN